MKKSVLLTIVLMFTVVISKAQSGITWGMGMNIASNTYSNHHPRMALDAQNNPMVIWGRMSDQSVMFSRWNGTMFTTPVALNPMWLTVATGSWQGPDIASKGDTVYVIVKRTPEAIDSNRIFIFTSFNGGVSFNTPVELGYVADSISRFPTVTVDATGNPIVAFMKFDAGFGDARWVVTKSADYGNTFTTDVKASGQTGGVVCDCCPGSILNRGSDVAMLYRSNIGNIRDSWAGLSADGANTFPVGFNVDQNNWNLFACPSSGPDGEIIGDTLYTVFMNGASGISRTYLSKTSISNSSLNSVNLLTGTIPMLGQQNYPRIASSGNAMAIVWKQSVNSVDQLPLLFTNNIANGFPASYDTVDLSHITNVDVALSNGKIFVIWEDDNSGTVKYRTGTYTSVTSVSEIEENPIAVFPNPAVSNSIFVQLKNNLNAKVEIEITNVVGQQIKKQNLTPEHGLLNVDISNLNRGVYFLKVNSENDSFISKIIKR